MAGRVRIPRKFLVVFVISTLLMCSSIVTSYAEENAVSLTGTIMRWFPDQQIAVGSGGVQADYQDFKITADSAETNLQTSIAVFIGNVKLINKENTVEGERLVLNLKTKEWAFENAKSQIIPAAFQNRILSPAYIKGAEVSGDDDSLTLNTGMLTTCDLEHPHYYFSVKDLEFFPDSKIVAHNVSLVGLDKRLFTLGTLLIPIKGLGSTIVPQVGSSAEEGSFLKTSYAYMATDKNTGILKLDLMQKRGIGTGINHSYNIAEGDGSLSVYYLRDQEIGGNNITGTFQHQQKLGTVNMNFNAGYRTNSYLYYPATTARDWQLTLNHNNTRATTAMAVQSSSNKGSGTSDNLTTTIRHMRQFSDNLNGIFSVNMRSYNSTGMTSSDRELDSTIELRQRADKFDLSLTATKRTDMDGDEYTGDNFYSSLDRLPELTLDTDSYRLGNKTLFGIPYRLSISAGKYHEMPTDTTGDRLLLQFDMLDKSIDIGSKNELNLSGGFRQAYYASDMAQYMLKMNSTLTTRYTDYLKSRVSWNYQKPDGYSPFRFDYTGKYNYARAILDYQNSSKMRWSLSSGYQLDNRDNPWQDMAFRFTAHPDSSYAYSLSTGYDLNRGKWRNLISQFQVSKPKKIGLDIGTRYDMELGKFDMIRGRFDIYAGKKWRVEGITSWDGATKQFDYKAFRLTRDLHCCEVSVTYNDESGFRNDKGIRLDFRIKALPMSDRFGIGQFGQSVDTSMGEYNY
ncbi:MAG: LPS-assembly protein LptD [Armatimonadota bacterium]